MLTQVIVGGITPKTFNLEGVDPNESLLLQSISGLTSTEVTLFTGDFARDGGYYQGRRAGKRNPVFMIKLNPDYVNNVDVSDLRETLYKIFHEPTATSDGVTVTLKDDKKPDRYFVGYTEHIDSDQFEKTQKAQVSMITTDPYLRSSNPTTVSDANGLTSTIVSYDGSAKTGIEVTLKVKTADTIARVSLGNDSMVLSRSAGFAVNDTIYINTNIGSRAVKLNGVDIMASLSATSTFLQLHNGAQTLQAGGAAWADGKVVVMSYTFRSAWWGI